MWTTILTFSYLQSHYSIIASCPGRLTAHFVHASLRKITSIFVICGAVKLRTQADIWNRCTRRHIDSRLLLQFQNGRNPCSNAVKRTHWRGDFNKKLSYRRRTARCVVSVEILPIATQQCRNYLYDKS